jgi:hypothetical protein
MTPPVERGLWLGRLISPPEPGSPAEALLSEVRLQLVTAVFERVDWLPAWERAVDAATPLVGAEIEAWLREAGRMSRYPARKLRKVLPSEADREILAARLSAASMGLEAAANDPRRPAGSTDAETRMICGELEVAWDRLVATADEELAGAERLAARIRGWKRPLWPLLVGSLALLSLAAWTGLVLGGYLAAPGWFQPIANWIWSW